MPDNVLGVLFQDIADAIRTKTGGTDTMKPAEFPAEIAAIETGGGGGVELDGLYWERLPILPDNKYSKPFLFKNQLYFYTCTYADNIYTAHFYKYENKTLTLVKSFPLGNKNVASSYADFIELDGEIHMVGSEYSSQHYSWDGGDNFTQYAALSNGHSGCCFCGYEGDLYGVEQDYYSNKNLIKWNKETDTWSVVYTHSSFFVRAFSDGNFIYLLNRTYKEMYKLDMATLTATHFRTCPSSPRVVLFLNENMYTIYDNKDIQIQKNSEDIGHTPSTNVTYIVAAIWNNKMYFVNTEYVLYVSAPLP